VLVWAANLILAALDCDLRASQGFRFAPCRLLIAGGEEPALLPLETGAQRSWSARSNTVSNVQMSPSESSPTARPCTVRRRAVAALGS
jgi:hypothetical protein